MFLASHTAPAVAPALATASIVVPPVGLLLQGAVTGIALRSAYKTHRHYKDLMKLWKIEWITTTNVTLSDQMTRNFARGITKS